MRSEPEVWAQGPSLLASILLHWGVVTVLAGALAVAAYAISATQDAVYEASAQLIFSDIEVQALATDEEDLPPVDQTRQLQNRANQIRSAEVLERAVDRLGPGVDPSAVHGGVQIWLDPNMSDVIAIVARASEPQLAAEIANAVGEAYQELAEGLERRRFEEARAELDRSIERLQARVGGFAMSDAELDGTTPEDLQRQAAITQLISLTNRRERLVLAADLAGARIGSFERAYPPYEPIAPRPKRTAAVGLMLGAALGSAFAYWREGRGGVAREAEQVRALLDVPLLAQVPRKLMRRWPRPTTPAKFIDAAGGQYEFLGVTLDRFLNVRGGSTVLVTGVRSRRDSPVVALNVAFRLCNEDRNIVLVDADLRGRQLTRLLQFEVGLGLSDLAETNVSFERLRTVGALFGDETWTFVPAGTPAPDPYRLLRSSSVVRLLEEIQSNGASDQAVRVVLHGPPVLEVADAGILAALAHGVVLHVPRGTALEDLRRVDDTLRLAGGQLLGFVFVGGRVKGPRPRRRGSSPTSGTARKATVGAVR